MKNYIRSSIGATVSRTTFLAIALLSTALSAQDASVTHHQAWVLAMDAKGSIPSDIKAEEWKVEVGGLAVPLKRVDSPELTGTLSQNWALVFEPILDPHFRSNAFQSTAQFLLNLPEGDRVLFVARTKEGLVPLTPGLSPDPAEWRKALEQLPSVLGMTFEGTPGAMSPSLVNLANPAPQAVPASHREAFGTFVKTYLEALPKTCETGPYGKPEPRGMKAIERLGFDSPSEVRGKLKVVGAEMKALEHLFASLGKLKDPTHCVVFSRSEADDFTHPSTRAAMTGKFTRTTGDQGGPAETAELANREIKLAQADLRKSALLSGITLYSVAGSGLTFRGNLAAEAEATGGFAFYFDAQLPARFGSSILAFGSRYRLLWDEPAGTSGSIKELSIRTTRKGLKLITPTQR
jgi:hypothetical protein